MRIEIAYGEDECQWLGGAKEGSWIAGQVLFLGLSGGYMDVLYLWACINVTPQDLYTFLYVCYTSIKMFF